MQLECSLPTINKALVGSVILRGTILKFSSCYLDLYVLEQVYRLYYKSHSTYRQLDVSGRNNSQFSAIQFVGLVIIICILDSGYRLEKQVDFP